MRLALAGGTATSRPRSRMLEKPRPENERMTKPEINGRFQK